jgi:hypothetical protein
MKSFLILVFIIPISLIASVAYAEGACPPGQYPIGGQGAIACAPIPQGSPVQQEARPNGKWIKTWGAVAVGSIDSTTSYGVTTGKLSKSAAEQDAMRRCASHGETNCKLALAYENQCAVVVEPHINGLPFPTGVSRVVGRGTVHEASQAALEICKEDNRETPAAKCEIVYSACSEPIFQKF